MSGRVKVRIAAAVILSLLSISCSVFLKHEYEDLSAADKERYLGTQVGFHRLSPYFAVAVGGGSAGKPRLMQIYYYENGTSRRHLIGVIEAVKFESADYGPRDQHFAISDDGRNLLYFHEANHGYGALDKPDGLYLATAEGKEQLVRGTGERLIQPEEVTKYLSP
jgi:hypothetical protein